jgi:L-lactate permease
VQGAWPICLIILAAIFTYDMSVATGHFTTLKFSIVSVSHDKRLLALLLAYCFSGFIEGASGFGTPIALAASMMVGVGFTPREAAQACLLGNTVPVPFGGIGIPIVTLAQVTRIPAGLLAVAVTRLLLPFSLVVPFLVVYVVSPDLRRSLEVWPACALTAAVSTSAQLVVAQFVSPQPVSIISSLLTLAALSLFLSVWHPRSVILTDLMAAEEVGMMAATTVEQLATKPLPPLSVPPGAADERTTEAPTLTIPAVDVEMARASPARRRSFDDGRGAVVGAPTTTTATTATSTPTGPSSTATPTPPPFDRRASLTRHLSLRVDKAHRLQWRQELERRDASAAAAAAGVGTVSRPRAASGTSAAPADVAAAAAATDAPVGAVAPVRAALRSDAPSLAGSGGHVFVMRRLLASEAALQSLDSSSVATALFPHSMEHRQLRAEQHPGRRKSTFTRVRAPSRAGAATVAAAAAAVAATAAPAGVTTAHAGGALFSPPRAEQRDDTNDTLAAAADAGGEWWGIDHEAAAGGSGGGVGGATAAATSSAPAVPAAPAAATAAAAAEEEEEEQHHYDALHPPTRREMLTAWFPWVLLAGAVCVWGAPAVKGSTYTDPPTGLSVATVLVPIAGLDGRIIKPDPRHPGDPAFYSTVEARWAWDTLAATGTCLFLCAGASSAVYRLHPRTTATILWRSFRRMALSFATVCTLLAFGYVLKFSGMDTTLGLAAAKAGRAYPFVGPFIGFLGVVVTGSSTSSNVLFGGLQIVAAQQLGVNPVQMAASNTSGIANIVSVASLVVASAATGSGKSVAPIAKSVAAYALALITAYAALNLLVINVAPGYIPSYDLGE